MPSPLKNGIGSCDPKTGEAIDRFLGTRPITRPELRAYAEAAKTGYIL